MDLTQPSSSFPRLDPSGSTSQSGPLQEVGSGRASSPTSQSRKSISEESRSSQNPAGDYDTHTATGHSHSRLFNFLTNTRTFFSRLWHYKLDVGMGLLNITGGLLLIFLVDFPLAFLPEGLMKGLPFFMIGAGFTQIVMAMRSAYVDVCNPDQAQYSDKTPVVKFRTGIGKGPDDVDPLTQPVNKPTTYPTVDPSIFVPAHNHDQADPASGSGIPASSSSGSVASSSSAADTGQNAGTGSINQTTLNQQNSSPLSLSGQNSPLTTPPSEVD